MLSQYNPIDIEIILREENPPPLIAPAADRVAWNAVRAAISDEAVADIVQWAEEAASSEIPSLSASLYLEFKRNGQREGYEQPLTRRREMQTALTLAECLEYEGRFLDPLMDVTWAICEESSWAYPAHQSDLTDLDHPYIDLGVVMTGAQMAEVVAVLGDDLDPLVSKRVRDEMNRRVFTPYLTRHDHWWLYSTQIQRVNNWTAVCNGNIIMAAIHLENDLARLADMIGLAARSLDEYLVTFDSDGGSTEGPGYWGYGFGNYVLAAQMVEHRSNGRLAFMGEGMVRKVAAFPLNTILSPGCWVNFSDARLDATFPGSLLVYLAQRLELPRLTDLYHEQNQRHVSARRNELTWAFRELLWRTEPPASGLVQVVPNQHDWYSEMHWMVARYDPADPDGLVLAAKGGTNGEMHNQNDVGNFIVHVHGEPVIADLGSGRYTRMYFSETRYEHFVCQSFGHSCPVPNGQMQGPLSRAVHGQIPTPEQQGTNFYSTLLEHHADDTVDRLKIEMKHVYPAAADLDSLVRTVALHREEPRGWVEVVDEVQFASGPGTLESALTTFGNVELGDSAVLLKGEQGTLHVAYDEDVVTPRVDLVEEVDLATGARDVRRVAFALLQPQQHAIIRLNIVPV